VIKLFLHGFMMIILGMISLISCCMSGFRTDYACLDRWVGAWVEIEICRSYKLLFKQLSAVKLELGIHVWREARV
jgi:hypothetical protein